MDLGVSAVRKISRFQHPKIAIPLYFFSLSNLKVCFNTEGEVEIKQQETISYYILDGEEQDIWDLRGFVHDEQHLIIAHGHRSI